MLAELEKLRAETPGCAERIHLNNAGAGLMPQPVLNTIQEYLVLESKFGGYETADMQASQIGEAYESVARLVGAQADNIAFVENATVGWAQAISCIPFQPGDKILTSANDYIPNQIIFLSLAKRFGVEVIYAEESTEGGVNVDSIANLIDEHKPRLVAVTHIPTNSGLIQPVEAIGKVCRERNVLYLVDACQSVGQIPVDVEQIGCDFLSATSRKFLRGPRGCGFLYVSDRVLNSELEPLFIDMQGARWIDPDVYERSPTAHRFENWEFSYALVLGTGAAADYALSLGTENVSHRAIQLASSLRGQLSDLSNIFVQDQGARKGAIVTIYIPEIDPDTLVKQLQGKKINTTLSLREYAVIDFDRKQVPWALRLSPHYYNSETEIEAAVKAIEELARR